MQKEISLTDLARYRDALLGILQTIKVEDLTDALAEDVKLVYQLIELIESRMRASP